MNEESPTQAVGFDPLRYTKRVLALILAKAEQWQVSPSIAEARLLDELVAKTTA